MCGYKTVVGMVNGMLEELNITVPVALHLDHGSYEGAKACIEAGFSSIMFDGSHYPIEENVEKTKRTGRNLQKKKDCLLKQKLVQSAVKKMVSLVPASVQIQTNVRWLLTLV